jgi:hypothetical protein
VAETALTTAAVRDDRAGHDDRARAERIRRA